MTFNKKKTRPITVGEVDYRFGVSISKIDEGRDYRLNISVQKESGDGAILKAIGLLTRDFWSDAHDLPPVESWQSTYPTVTPKHIAVLIKKAIADGWQSDVAGPPYELALDNVSLFGE